MRVRVRVFGVPVLAVDTDRDQPGETVEETEERGDCVSVHAGSVDWGGEEFEPRRVGFL